MLHLTRLVTIAAPTPPQIFICPTLQKYCENLKNIAGPTPTDMVSTVKFCYLNNAGEWYFGRTNLLRKFLFSCTEWDSLSVKSGFYLTSSYMTLTITDS